jgi:hypothetical protein
MHAMKETMKAPPNDSHKGKFDDDGVVSFSVLAQWPLSLSLSFFLNTYILVHKLLFPWSLTE